jgi:GT2 family glycosyltransferase
MALYRKVGVDRAEGDPPPVIENLPLVSVIVACYGQRRMTEDLVRTLDANAGCRFELILVDNGCPEGTAAWARRTYGWIKVVEMGRNAGVPAAYNAGVTASRGGMIALWNNDMLCHPNGLRRLAEYAHLRGMAAQTGGLWNERGEYAGCTGETHWSDFAEGYTLTFKREVWDAAGEWDETFFPSYGDDVDWVLRARLKGYDYVLVPECVTHFGQATSGSMNLKVEVRAHQGIIRERYLRYGLGQRILVVRWGAAGDLLMMTPAIRALRAKHPLSRLHVYCDPVAGLALHGNPYIDFQTDGALEVHRYSQVIGLVNAYEEPQRHGRWEHPARLFCEKAGVEYDGQPYDVRYDAGLKAFAAERLP